VKLTDCIISTIRILWYNLPENRKSIESLKEAIIRREDIPLIKVYIDGDKFQFHDGVHRYIAYLELGFSNIKMKVYYRK